MLAASTVVVSILSRRSSRWLTLCVSLSVLPFACKSSVPPELVDNDGDNVPDQSEDRDQDGMVDPGETNPNEVDTDDDGIDDINEVSTIACAKINDRPYEVYDVPGADSMILMDAQVRERATLRTMDNKAPGASLVDPDLDVAAVLISKRPADGVATPSAQRDHEKRTLIRPLGEILNERERALTTIQGHEAEQASFAMRLTTPATPRALAAQLATGLLNGVALTGTPAPGGTAVREVTINLLTIVRSPQQVVILAAVAAGVPAPEGADIRLEELTDGTNVARHESFTRHVCDQFVAKEKQAVDIIWVVDDSGSMEDDQMAVRAAADAMAEVLTNGGIDYRLGVARHFAQDENSRRRGDLEGQGLTADLEQFKEDIVVGAQGGWEPGLETGILAIDRLLPKTAAGEAPNPQRLREDAATVIVNLSDERDQNLECLACGSCEEPDSRQRFCTEPAGQPEIDRFISAYTMRSAVVFAIVGDLPNGCQQSGSRDDFEPGQGYVEVANGTGGSFGSLCGDMRANVQDIARAATGIASDYTLSSIPASASIRIAKGQPGQGVTIPRNRQNGWDYDPVRNRIVFYGSARPVKGEEIVVGYRRWDWKGNPNRPADPCDLCEVNTSCNPESDLSLCEAVCGEVVCEGGQACLPDTATCGDPSQVPMTPPTACGGDCDPGLVCNPSTTDCVVPCEMTGCAAGQICSAVTHLCQIPNF
jgi:hypothetical protein